MANPTYQLLQFDDLEGWADDNHQEAMDVFLSTCGDMRDPDWASLCDVAQSGQEARGFFERFFTPVLIDDGNDALFTGYYEPELRGSLTRGGPYQYPLYRLPPNPSRLSRREIEETNAFEGQGLEIAWIDDAVDVFFLQVQGSGRVKLDDGSVIRVGYGGANGREYSSVGRALVERGVYQAHQVSADVIRNWVRRNGDVGRELLWTNESFVFFREVNEVPADKGPLGAMNRSVTPMRTVAIDPSYIPYGAPVWIEKNGADPLNRLMVAQDTGSAIRGSQRADIFFGTGDRAGRDAGRIKDGGRLVVLMPLQSAYALLPDVIE
ncbi:MltA domain-containing protein [Octadecabacter sp. G9-8]|uniref:peptidoglycan lytic exotransglycosylase n=2 Tax=Octadecabacter dasysiphoniae TaxID=2909341 RepID=A0ABS9CW43_9RHOB|nr:MltA domain-containing protein [Octadecabacter dasysiphoniae]MCF2871491.1 MltA domain-containing protein [Octadecabacter dasysiphoniae]